MGKKSKHRKQQQAELRMRLLMPKSTKDLEAQIEFWQSRYFECLTQMTELATMVDKIDAALSQLVKEEA